jgi:hypothetical protein
MLVFRLLQQFAAVAMKLPRMSPGMVKRHDAAAAAGKRRGGYEPISVEWRVEVIRDGDDEQETDETQPGTSANG